jgi:hypothetical protein
VSFLLLLTSNTLTAVEAAKFLSTPYDDFFDWIDENHSEWVEGDFTGDGPLPSNPNRTTSTLRK